MPAVPRCTASTWPTQAGDVRESISLTGQFAAVDEILTGRENLVLVARLRHLPDAGRIADALLARFQLADAADRKVSTYSGGMRRRLDIAMSLIGNPPVVFLDEPTTGLDPEARLEVWQAVRDLAANGTTVLLTTQYLDEAEQLADRIAILHDGRIIENGTLAELKALLPPAKVEYVEKQPTLEDVFLALVGHDGTARPRSQPMSTHFVGDTALLTGRSLRHITRSLDTIITTTIMPIAFLLLFVFVFGGAIDTGTGVVRRLPAARHPDHHRRVGGVVHRLPALRGPAERDLRAVPLDADRQVSSVLWAHVITSLAAIAMSVAVVIVAALLFGFRSGAGVFAWLAVAGILALFTLALTWLAVIPGLTAKSVDGASAFSYPLVLLPFISSAFVPTATMPGPVRAFAENQPVTAIVDALRNLMAAAAGRHRHLGSPSPGAWACSRSPTPSRCSPTAAGSPDAVAASGRLRAC